MRYARLIERLIGLLFICTAAAKAYDLIGFAVQVQHYGILEDKDLIRAAAYAMTALEALLGAALLAGVRLGGLVLPFTMALTVVFSALIGYGWAYHGLEDCGCFGAAIQMGPGASLVKNAVLLGFTAYAWLGIRRRDAATQAERDPSNTARKTPLPAFAFTLCVIAAAWFLGNPGSPLDPGPIDENRPFTQFHFTTDEGEFDLGTGSYVVAVLSASCDHCQASVAVLNELTLLTESPKVVGLVSGDDTEFEDFSLFTAPLFPTSRIDIATLFDFVGESPPRFYLVRDGAEVLHLDDKEVTLDALLPLIAASTDQEQTPAA